MSYTDWQTRCIALRPLGSLPLPLSLVLLLLPVHALSVIVQSACCSDYSRLGRLCQRCVKQEHFVNWWPNHTWQFSHRLDAALPVTQPTLSNCYSGRTWVQVCSSVWMCSINRLHVLFVMYLANNRRDSVVSCRQFLNASARCDCSLRSRRTVSTEQK